jgi:DNA-binding beta-propeller fold protein YncE
MAKLVHVALVCLALVSCGDSKGEAVSTAQSLCTSNLPPTGPFTVFESGQVRPLALSPDGKRLFAVNTPDNRLEIFDVKNSGLKHRHSLSVGLEPVAVAARSDHEVWVVNHLSDSVSVVDLSQQNKPRVVRTLLVGDEPRDIVFGGPGRGRAFITTAHRGQNVPFDPQLTTPGVGRADVWVFNASALGGSLGGDPITIVTLFSDTPRALAVTPDGATVYAAAFHSGNRTTTVHQQLVPNGGELAGGLPAPNTNFELIPQKETALIVQFDGAHWVDTLGRHWDEQVKFNLPDKDVFAIDATANPPAQVAGPTGFFTGVGTILFNMAVNPVSGKVYVANTEANNLNRFEGPGDFAGHSIQGHLHESRITVLDGGSALPRHLNKHIDFDACCAPAPNPENEKSLAMPQEMAVTSDGATLYVAALGSDKIGVFSTAELENDTFVPSAADHIEVTGGGPTGLVLDEARGRMYVLTRFDNAISIVDLSAQAEIGHVAMFNPEPPSVVDGRRFLYDASLTSSHGDSSCASCHLFGDFDSLAWDLGNPDGVTEENPNVFLLPIGPPFGPDPEFFPMKGPMSTQSLRGMANHGPMHWRGDRSGGYDVPPGTSAQPDTGAFDEESAFKQFQVGFTDLLGRSAPLSDEDMQQFTDFMLQVTYPPNPIRALDSSLTPEQQLGLDNFTIPSTDFIFTCRHCHVLEPDGNAELGVAAPGFFGTDGRQAGDGLTQSMKTPHLRNLYQKVGMFGMAEVPGPLSIFSDTTISFPVNHEHMGDQIRGFGFIHDGSVDTVFRFVSAPGFTGTPFPGFEDDLNPEGFPFGPAGDPIRRGVEAFLLAFDSNMAPVVGQQVTLTSTNAAVAGPRIDLLEARALVGDCDLVVKGRKNGKEVGYLLTTTGEYVRDKQGASPLTDAQLRALATHPKQELTFTCAPPGSGVRVGLDRDSDGTWDGDE